MARIRTIKPEFWTDRKTGTLSPTATKLFIGMLNHADDYGVIEYDPLEIRAKIFPYEANTVEVISSALVDELLPRGLVVLFKWEDKSYLLIANFTKHQKVDHPGRPIIEGFDVNEVIKNLSDSDNPRESSRALAPEGSSKGRERKVVVVEYAARINTFFDGLNGRLTKLKADYPGLDVPGELVRMRNWLLANKNKRKSNIERFMVNWLNGEAKKFAGKKDSTQPGYRLP